MAAGPANCTDLPDETEGLPEDGQGLEEEAVANCVGVLDGGVDDITPVQIWNKIMKKYKVAQLCGQEIESA